MKKYVSSIISNSVDFICYFDCSDFYSASKNQSSNVFDSSSGALFERTKARGFEAVMQRITAILIFLWMLDALALVIISSK